MNLAHDFPRMSPEGKTRVLAALAEPCGGYFCTHTAARLTQRNIRGVVTVHLQCQGCGRSLGGAQKRADHYYWQSYAEWCDDLVEAHRNHVAERHAALYPPIVRAPMPTPEERREEYRNVFLRSPGWRTLRARVMRRAQGMCEVCLNDDATDVHHLTYNLGRLPPAWELKAVCRACHDRMHDWEGGAEG